MTASLSNAQFGGESITANKQAMPESTHFDGPAGINVSSADNSMAANAHTNALPKPGFSS